MKLFVGFILFLLSSVGFCQTAVNSSATVKVKLIKSLKIEKIKGNLDFGEIILNGSNQDLLKKPNEGIEFVILGHPQKEAIVTYQPALLLPEEPTNKKSLIFLPAVFETGDNINFTSPKNVKSGTAVQLENNNGIGKTFIWVGGKIKLNSNQSEGDYKGTFTISVAY